MISWLKGLLDDNKRTLKDLQPLVDATNRVEAEIKKLSDDELRAKTAGFKLRLAENATLDDILPEAYAVVREAAFRELGLRMFDVQLLAAIAFHKGMVAEQKTGEGKTLSAVPALYLNSLTGRGAHLVTVNDYLARLGSGWMGRVFARLDVTVGVIYSGKGEQPARVFDLEYSEPDQVDDRLRHLKPVPRQEAYGADITYGTNNEFGFDYLRDNMVQSLKDMTQRGHAFAIVDEVDSILIDEARTPLIISAPDTEPTDKYYQFAQLVDGLSVDTDYMVDEKLKSAALTEHGITKIEKKLKIDNLYEKDFEIIHHLENALKARSLYLKDRDYVVKDDQIIIVDEFTGRLMYGRRWSEGLHQAVEAKEGVKIQQESKTLATISFQNYFRMYEKLAGMTGTAATEAEEFERIYGLRVLVVPTHRPTQRQDHSDMIYKTTRAKYTAIAEEIKQLHEKGQPVLLGTTSIDKNQVVSDLLKRRKVPHQVLNAKNHEQEATIIAKAGQVGAVTIATNIAGRGVDIMLGGPKPEWHQFDDEKAYKRAVTDWDKEHDNVVALGGLFVIGTERHESRRIDNQLRGRSGRQGDPGASRFYVALDDDIMRIFGGERVAKLMDVFKLPEDVPLEHRMVSNAIAQAQTKVEGFHFDSRKRVVEYDDVMNKQRVIIYGRRKQVLEAAAALEEGVKGETQDVASLQNDNEIHNKILENLEADIEHVVNLHAPEGYEAVEYEQIVREFAEIVPLDLSSQKALQADLSHHTTPHSITEKLTDILHDAFSHREKQLGKQLLSQIEVFITLRTMDKLWMDHLDNLHNLRDGIGLRGYGQRDPLVEYKNEAFTMFERLLANIDYEVGRQIMRVEVAQRPAAPRQMVMEHPDSSEIADGAGPDTIPQAANPMMSRPIQRPVVNAKKIGRNDPCWCGKKDSSGKPVKWKKCHYPQLG